MEQSPSWEANGSAASQEIPRIFGTRRFLTALTSARHLSLSWPNSIQSPQPPPTSWRSIPPGLTYKNSTWCSHCVYVFCGELERATKFALHDIKTLNDWSYITEVDSVYRAVGTESLYIKQNNFVFKGLNAVPLSSDIQVCETGHTPSSSADAEKACNGNPSPHPPLPRAITTCTGTTLPLPPSTFTLTNNSVYPTTNITFENACIPGLTDSKHLDIRRHMLMKLRKCGHMTSTMHLHSYHK